MVEIGDREPAGGLYGRLLQRLALALEEARENPGSSEQDLLELDVQGISEAELELIRAYREGDLQWLRGWQAAAHELAFIRQRREGSQRTELPEGGSLPLLSCALCGEVLTVPCSEPAPVCRGCGSRLFRSGKSR